MSGFFVFGALFSSIHSQHSIPDDPNAQFLVQPYWVYGPQYPKKERFYTGGTPGNYRIQNQTFSFTWLPTSISWTATSSKGDIAQTYQYTTATAQSICDEDYVPCAQSTVQVRLNLWNVPNWTFSPEQVLAGGYQIPTDYDYLTADRAPDLSYLGIVPPAFENITDYSIQVVIDQFSFQPAERQFVPDGDVCSKHCQCAVDSECLAGVCTPAM